MVATSFTGGGAFMLSCEVACIDLTLLLLMVLCKHQLSYDALQLGDGG